MAAHLRLALVPLAVAAIACQRGSSASAELSVATSWGGGAAEALNRELLRVGQELGDVSVDLRFQSPTGLSDYLARAQPSGGLNPIDLVVVPNDWLGQLAERGVITELPAERIESLRQKLVGQALLAVSDHDRVLAFPLSAEVLALVYDPQRFPSPPRTLDEVLAAPLPPDVIPLALNVLSPEHLAPLVASFQGSLVDLEGSFLWRDEALVAAMRHLAPLWQRPGGWRVCFGDDPESLQLQLFAEGKLASFVAGPWILEALEETGRPFRVMPIPGFAASENPARALVGYQCLAVLRESRWADLALEVGARMVSDEVDERLNRSTRRLPVLRSSYQSKHAMASAGTVGFLRALEDGQFLPATANWSQGYQKAVDQLQRLRGFQRAPTAAQLAAVFSGGRR